MRYIRFAILAIIAVVLMVVALANRAPVTLNLLPDGLADLVRFPAVSNSVTLPLFVVIFAGILGGVLLGFVWEWLREHRQRADAAGHRRENARLSQEVAKMKSDAGTEDDVLALLEDAR